MVHMAVDTNTIKIQLFFIYKFFKVGDMKFRPIVRITHIDGETWGIQLN